MGRAPCCSKVGLQRGPWTAREDALLVKYIQEHGEGHWRILPKKAGLLRCGKSCRLRWMNYLRPDIKRGNITPEEDDLIIRLHSLLGNRWSLIAGRLPGRTDNEIKNYWNTHLSRRVKNSAGTSDHHQNRRREINKINYRKKQQKNDAQDGENSKTKIHLPKAVKASPFSVTRRVSTSVVGAGGTEASLCQSATSVNNKDKPAWVTDSDIHFVHDHDYSSSNNYIPGSDSYIVDGTCEEYQELLKNNDLAQLDSFIDSLLV